MELTFEQAYKKLKEQKKGHIESTMSDNIIYYNDLINNNPFTISPGEYEDYWRYISNKNINNNLITKHDLDNLAYNYNYSIKVIKDITHNFHKNNIVSCIKTQNYFGKEDGFILDGVGVVGYREIIGRAMFLH